MHVARHGYGWPVGWILILAGGAKVATGELGLTCINIYAACCIGMEFEYDPEKSSRNAEKHGFDFVEGQALWDDSGLLVLPSRFPHEHRYLAIGRIADFHWTAVFTERGERVRLISIRRSRHEERELYEQNQSGQF